MKTWNLGYEKSKKKAKDIYSEIGRVICPALGEEYVVFNRLGFNHLVRKGRIPRTKNEQKRRFVLLVYIENVIKNPEALIEYRESVIKEKVNRHGEKVLMEYKAKFWTFVENIKDCKIKIVIRQLDGGNKHFFSVMGNNVQISGLKKKNKKIPKK